MRRRSTLGTHGVAPVRVTISELLDKKTTSQSRLSVVPRQLDFVKASQAASTRWAKEQNNATVGESSRGPRFSLYGKVNNDTSVMDGISVLSETITEQAKNTDKDSQVSNQICTAVLADNRQGSSAVNVQPSNRALEDTVMEPTASCVEQPSVIRMGSVIKNPMVRGTKKSIRTSCSGTKIPKPKVHSSSKMVPAARLNSTAVFEEEEIAALTSTPHPEQRFAVSVRPPGAQSNAEMEQMKLLIMDQRNLMQVMRLSFQKMNLVMDQMGLLIEKLNIVVNSQCELEVQAKNSGELAHGTVDCKNDILKCSVTKKSDIEAPAITDTDDKENSDVGLSKSLAAFTEMKSTLKCLKTPTLLRSGPVSAETPDTVLSNRVHHQLENLLELSESDV